jgi:hypothetical protein
MSQSNEIDVTIHPANEDVEPITFENVNYISFVSSPGGQGEGTYGIPAMIADRKLKDEGLPATILYVNPQNITAMEAVRKS